MSTRVAAFREREWGGRLCVYFGWLTWVDGRDAVLRTNAGDAWWRWGPQVFALLNEPPSHLVDMLVQGVGR